MRFKLTTSTFYAGIMIGLIAGLFFACNEGDLFEQNGADLLMNEQSMTQQTTTTPTEKTFNKSVGAPVEGSIGRQWIKNYINSPSGGRLEYFLMIKDLQQILSKKGCVGICMYYARTAQNELAILPIGINENGALIKSNQINTENGYIDWATAQEWISNYKGAVKARFFGSNTFYRLMQDASSNVIRASYAIDNKGNPQLLLADAAISSPMRYEDESRPCPPYCPTPE